MERAQPYHEAFFVDGVTSFASLYYEHKSEAIRDDKMNRLQYTHYGIPEHRGDVVIMRLYFVFESPEENDSVAVALNTTTGDIYTAVESMNPKYPAESTNRTKFDLYKRLGIEDLQRINFDLFIANQNAEEIEMLQKLEEAATA